MKEYSWPIRIYYEDTDAGGVVYHARYIAFFERARTEILREYGIHQKELLNENIAFVVAKLNIEYKIPARLDDFLTVKTRVKELKKASATFIQTLCDDNGVVYSSAEVLVACVDVIKKRPCGFPTSFTAPFLEQKG